MTIENIGEGSSVIRQFVALSFVALSRPSHSMFKSSLRAEISNNVYSDAFYLKVRLVFLETIYRGRDAVAVVPVGFMDSYELRMSSRSWAEQFFNFKVIVINRCFSFKCV